MTDLQRRGDSLWVRHRNDTPVRAGQWHTELYCLIWMLKVARLSNPRWCPKEIRFRSKATAERRQVGEALACQRLTWGGSVTEFAVPLSMLSDSVRGHDAASCPDLRLVRDLFQHSGPAASVSRGVMQILKHSDNHWWSIHELAEVVGISARTLQRRLHEERTSYSTIVQEARLERALALLTDSDLPLSELATRVGFATHSNFTRAFRKWVGLQPSEFRRQRRAARH